MQNTETQQLQSHSTRVALARRYYVNERVYQRELTWLREHMWLMVGHDSRIPRAGDYFLYAFDRDSIIIVRDDDGAIRAHQNVCRHRGSRVCVKATGNARGFTCPYHAWSYGLDGSLVAAPFVRADLNKASHGLAACQVRVHSGLIFLTFAQSPPDFNSYIDFLARELEQQNVGQSKIVRRELLSVNANWKLVVQNNLECYHCRPAHPTFCAAHPGTSLGKPEERAKQSSYERVRLTLRNSERESKRAFRALYSDGSDSCEWKFLDRAFIGDGCITESVDGKPVAPLMGQCAYEGVQTVALPSPFTSIYLNPDHIVIYTFTPRSMKATDIDVLWLVESRAQENIDFDLSRVSAVWEPTLREDKVLAENVQAGIESSAYWPGPYMETEKFVADFDDWYLRRVLNERA